MAKWIPEKATEELAQDFEKRLADESEGVSLMPGVCTLLQVIPSNRWESTLAVTSIWQEIDCLNVICPCLRFSGVVIW